MAVTAVVQARMSSARLPGKVLREVAGQPLLGYLLDRLARARHLDRVIVATSLDSSDDAVAHWCERHGVEYHRGPLTNVLARFVEVARSRDLEALARISGDSPLLDPVVVDAVVSAFESAPCDIATNVFPRSFPRGQSAEVMRRDALEAVLASTTDPADLEHVTAHFYRHPQRWRIVNVSCAADRSGEQLSVDTPEDLAAFERLRAQMDQEPWAYHIDALLALRDNAQLT